MKPRIKDIAKEAGVSEATVSNALNHRRGVSAETMLKIEVIARKIGYAHEPAVSLQKCIRFVLYRKHGLVIMDTPFFAQLIEGIEQECHSHGYELVITHLSGNSDLAKIREVISNKSMAILMLATEMDEKDIAPFLEVQVPILILDNDFPRLNANTVVMDNFEAGFRATEYIIRQGHSNIGFLGSSMRFTNMDQREEGYRFALRKAGLQPREESLIYVEPTMEGAYRDMSDWLDKNSSTLPSAFFAGNDIIAVGVSRALKSHGFHLPEDVSLVGMDDLPVCQVVNPPLTTIAVPKKSIGKIAVRRLMSMIESAKSDAFQKIRVGISLIIRESVASIKEVSPK